MNPDSLQREAIKAALNEQWSAAAKINQKILKTEPENIAALNRLAKAFQETGQLQAAQKTYQKVLKINQYNPVAQKNLKRLKSRRSKNTTAKNIITVNQKHKPGLFLEEPGKTKVVKLIRLAPPTILAEMDAADPVIITSRQRFVSVIRPDGTYLGSLPEDLSQRLTTLIKGGNDYEAYVKAVDSKNLEIFIKETKKAARFKNIPSFVTTGSSYLAFNFDQ